MEKNIYIYIYILYVIHDTYIWGFPGGATAEELACQSGDIRDTGSIPGLGRCPGEGHDNLLQYPCLENPMDRRVWRAAVHGAAESDTAEAT